MLLRTQMVGGEEKSEDFYAVLGLKKECTAAELKDAYKKLAKVGKFMADVSSVFFFPLLQSPLN